MKPKIIGALILAAAAAVFFMLFSQSAQTTVIKGYLGGEKIGLFEDEEIAEYIRKNYRLEFDYSRAGSLDMVTADLSGGIICSPPAKRRLNIITRYTAAQRRMRLCSTRRLCCIHIKSLRTR